MKTRNICYCLFIVSVALLTTFILYNNKSYSYGILKQTSGAKGSKVIIYTDTETNSQISFEDARKYFGVKIYEEMYDEGNVLYFEKGKEISYQAFVKGSAAENADELAALYGKNAYRVHTTAEFKHAFDDIYQNLKIGEFHIIFSKHENIDFNEVNNYYKNNYGVTNFKENYYTYSKKGMWEPSRFGLSMNDAINNGELILNTTSIRISGNERVILEDFTNKLLPYLYGNGSEYDKILNAYTYIVNTSTYLTDNGFINDLLASNTSAYDALINRKTTCIGYSIAYSYILDKMGIESYIVDQVTEANEATNSFSSVHTYNIVKFNNKFYKVDLTGRIFLGGVNSNELYNSTLNLSNTPYNGNTSTNIDYNSINNLLNQSKSISTTTTKRVEPTTTQKTYSYSIPGGVKTTSNTNTQKTQETKRTTIVTTTDHEGNTITIPVEVTEEGNIVTNPQGEYQTVTTTTENINNNNNNNNKEDNNNTKKKGFNLNFILFPLLIIGILTLVILKVRDKKKVSIDSSKVQEILNRDIINKDEDNK